ncbi:hypothetical protein IFM89_008061, partial [Coptis chinensis]
MSSSLKNNADHSFDIDELLRVGTLCMELRKERDVLRESQSKSAQIIRGMELEVKSLSEARLEDRKEAETGIASLVCVKQFGHDGSSQSFLLIDPLLLIRFNLYSFSGCNLQDQLNLRNIEANWLGEHVHSLELKLTEIGRLQEKVNQLREELLKSNSERLFLMRELENKEMEVQSSLLCIEKLEEAIASIALDSECEIESLKLDLINLEQVSSEAKKFQEKAAEEKARMDAFIEEFASEIQDSQKMNEFLEEENRNLKEKLETSENLSRTLVKRIEEHLKESLESRDRSELDIWCCNKPENELYLSNETSTCEEVLGPLLSKLAVVAASDEDLKDDLEKMSEKINEYEHLVEQLKDELREEKVKAKEEAEDLTQEMAELRYQITGMLEEECRRRALVEQASLQRIAELEAQDSLVNNQLTWGLQHRSLRVQPPKADYTVDSVIDDDRLRQLFFAWSPEENRVIETGDQSHS